MPTLSSARPLLRCAISVALGLSCTSPSLPAEPAGETRVLLVAGAAADLRIALAREAIDYWDTTFSRLGVGLRWGEPEVLVAPSAYRILENYAWQISRRAGRPAAGDFEPAPPEELTALEADVVVLLSSQKLMPFAWPQPGDSRYFIAVDSGGEDSAAADDSTTRNVIAHELGHAIGLSHQAHPGVLMCFPCSALPASSERVFRPLASSSERRLLELYSETVKRDR